MLTYLGWKIGILSIEKLQNEITYRKLNVIFQEK